MGSAFEERVAILCWNRNCGKEIVMCVVVDNCWRGVLKEGLS